MRRRVKTQTRNILTSETTGASFKITKDNVTAGATMEDNVAAVVAKEDGVTEDVVTEGAVIGTIYLRNTNRNRSCIATMSTNQIVADKKR